MGLCRLAGLYSQTLYSQKEHHMRKSRGFSVQGLNHLGLIVKDMAVARRWFIEWWGVPVLEDRGELVFLGLGRDILAVKTPRMATLKPEHGGELPEDTPWGGMQTLDHYGFFAQFPDEVDAFADFLRQHQVEILKGPYDRKDGRSVYFRDPCGNVGEYLYCTLTD
jgi:catechol 2,3-dioxygenase-like lactoylglutathione lyase family enzyme